MRAIRLQIQSLRIAANAERNSAFPNVERLIRMDERLEELKRLVLFGVE